MPYKDPTSDAAKASRKRILDKRKESGKSKAYWKKYNARTQRNRYYKFEHGITEVEFEAQIVAQGGMCPIGNHPFGPRGKGKTSPCQDHDHETGKNRLILCREHNVGLGQFHDSIPELEAAISYLKQYQVS